MIRPSFPGPKGDIPEINLRLPSVVMDDEFLNLREYQTRVSLEGDGVLSELILHAQLEANNALKVIQNSNYSGGIERVLLNYIDEIGRGIESINEVRLGVAISNLDFHCSAIIKEEYASAEIMAFSSQIMSVNSMIEKYLPNWQKLQTLRNSIEFGENDIIESKNIYNSVIHTLEEAADLVSPELVSELKYFDSENTEILEAEREHAFLKVSVINNLLISLIAESRRKDKKKSNWIVLYLGNRIFEAARKLSSTSIGNRILGWVRYTSEAILNIFK